MVAKAVNASPRNAQMVDDEKLAVSKPRYFDSEKVDFGQQMQSDAVVSVNEMPSNDDGVDTMYVAFQLLGGTIQSADNLQVVESMNGASLCPVPFAKH